MNPKEFRKLISEGKFHKPTAGYCPGFVQANLLILPKKFASEFEKFAKKNHKAIPILEIVKNSFHTSFLANKANLLNELPSYDIFEKGKHIKAVKNIEKYYSKDLVFFLIGCSFTFENSLIQGGIPLRHIKQKKNVSMYNTGIKLNTSGIFKGNMVVSMRPIKKHKVTHSCVITSHFDKMHGSPIHIGYSKMIGIKNINKPDYGDYIEIKDDEIAVFWPCGVTPVNVLKEIKIPFAITHTPGHMFVSDKKDNEFYE